MSERHQQGDVPFTLRIEFNAVDEIGSDSQGCSELRQCGALAAARGQ